MLKSQLNDLPANLSIDSKFLNKNLFISSFSQLNKLEFEGYNGGCSSVVECETVALETWVRFPAPAYYRGEK